MSKKRQNPNKAWPFSNLFLKMVQLSAENWIPLRLEFGDPLYSNINLLCHKRYLIRWDHSSVSVFFWRVPPSVQSVNKGPDCQPNGESNPGCRWQLSHQVNVDEYAGSWQEGNLEQVIWVEGAGRVLRAQAWQGCKSCKLPDLLFSN